MIETEYSDKFYDKFVEGRFKRVDNANWLYKAYKALIDSWWPRWYDVSKFLKVQIDSAPSELIDIADSLYDLDPHTHILKVRNWVKSNHKYLLDSVHWQKSEYWQSALETIKEGSGDCEDLNSLIYILAVLGGMPQICLWSVVGNTYGGGHYWLIYYSPKTDKFYTVDATVGNQTELEEFALNSVYKEVWYMFNEDRCYRPMYGVFNSETNSTENTKA